MPRTATKPDCYDYVRGYYNVPAYVGVRVKFNGREGVLVDHRGAGQYVWILFDGDKGSRGPYHPTDAIEYLPLAGTQARFTDGD
jgi:hypothetical protein